MMRRSGRLALAALLAAGCGHPDYSQVSGDFVRLTLARDDGGNLGSVGRSTQPDVYLRVTLRQAPIGAELPLACDWSDPSGKAVRHNRYHTKPITDPVWPTHCHQLFGPDSATGTWTVDLLLQGHRIAQARFELLP